LNRGPSLLDTTEEGSFGALLGSGSQAPSSLRFPLWLGWDYRTGILRPTLAVELPLDPRRDTHELPPGVLGWMGRRRPDVHCWLCLKAQAWECGAADPGFP